MHEPVHEEAYQGHTIKIYHDPDAESPREWCNLGTLICWHRRYRLGDSHRFDSPEAFLRDRAERKAILLPVFLYDHSGLAMNTIGFHCPWDSGQVGYVYVALDAVRKEFGVKRVTKALREKAEDILRGEIVSYDAYLGGRVYGYVIEQDGEEVDACWGYFGHYELDCLSEARAFVDQMILREAHRPAAAQGASPPPS